MLTRPDTAGPCKHGTRNVLTNEELPEQVRHGVYEVVDVAADHPHGDDEETGAEEDEAGAHGGGELGDGGEAALDLGLQLSDAGGVVLGGGFDVEGYVPQKGETADVDRHLAVVGLPGSLIPGSALPV